ncbi:MAG: outer membrane beta-barrel protein [Verrucomicrobiota bacterium]
MFKYKTKFKNATKSSIFLLTFALSWAAESPTESKEKDLKKVLEEQGIYVETSKPGIKLSGYVDAGYSYNFTGRDTAQVTRGANDGQNATESGGDFNLYNFKLTLEKALPEENTWSAGFRTDLNYGEDALLKTGNAASDSVSSLWLQQAYVNFNIPVGNGLQIKLGKWSALTGFEAPERPANPNISGGLVATLEPGEHVGLLGTYSLNKNFTFNLGIANADWGNNADGVSVLDGSGNSNVLYTGSLQFGNSAKTLCSKFIVVSNPYGGSGILSSTNPAGAANQVINEGESLLFNHNTVWTPKCCNDKLMLGYNTLLGFYNNYAHAPVGSSPRDYNESYWGLAGYAKYIFNDLFSLAQRIEYISCDDGAKFGQNGSALTAPNLNGKKSEAFGFTTTVGFNLWDNMLLRAEYRADFTHVNDPSGAASANGDETVTHLAIAEVVYSF